MIPCLRRSCILLFAPIVVAASACNSGPPFAEVSGVVLLDGKPMPDAIVQFIPELDKNTNGPTSSGNTDEEGRFRLKSDDKYGKDGAVVGFHRVVVQDTRSIAPPRHLWADRMKRPATPPSRISNRYGEALKTPLRQEVKAGPQTITLELTSK
jgi:hypothetical protein